MCFEKSFDCTNAGKKFYESGIAENKHSILGGAAGGCVAGAVTGGVVGGVSGCTPAGTALAALLSSGAGIGAGLCLTTLICKGIGFFCSPGDQRDDSKLEVESNHTYGSNIINNNQL